MVCFFCSCKCNNLLLYVQHKCCAFLCGKQKTKPIVISLQKIIDSYEAE